MQANQTETDGPRSLQPDCSARLYECPGCGERKPQDKFPDDPSVPGLCAACDLLVRSDDEPTEAVHREEAPNDQAHRQPPGLGGDRDVAAERTHNES